MGYAAKHSYGSEAGPVRSGDGARLGPRAEVQGRQLRVSVVEFLGRGGLIHYAYQFCRGLAARGALVELVTDEDYELAHLTHDFRVTKLFRLWNPRPEGEVVWSTSLPARLGRAGRRARRAAIYYRQWWRLIRHLRRERPDVVQFGEIRFITDLVPLLALRLSGLRLADVCHNVAPFDISADSDRLVKTSPLYRALFRHIYSCFSPIFVHSEVNAREFLRLYGGPPGRVHVIPHGNERMFVGEGEAAGSPPALAGELGLPAGAPVALFFGTLTKYKGVEYLIDAFAEVERKLPGARLVVAGFPNPEVDARALRARAAGLGLERSVIFHLRYVPIEDVRGLFAAADVVVFPYLMIYQSGALQVAYSFGKPVVATNVGGFTDVVEHGGTGLLVPPRDAAALADALVTLLSDGELAARMGRRALEVSETIYSWEEIGGRVLDAYRAVAGGAEGAVS